MLLTISTTRRPASDLGYLLHKHPERFQTFALSFGQAHVFYPEVGDDRTTAALLLDVDPVGLVRGKSREAMALLDSYVNDRPYAATSFLSVAVSQVFGTALAGRCQHRPELVDERLPFEVRLTSLPVRGSAGFVAQLFEPLGYAVEVTRRPLDETFPDWGESPYVDLTLCGEQTLSQLLSHLYVLIPVFDGRKHYFVGDDEVEKLLDKGAGWLAAHPAKELIAKRYLRHRVALYREALARLAPEEVVEPEEGEENVRTEEPAVERALSLNEQRHAAVLAALRTGDPRSVLDLGCGEGKLLRQLAYEKRIDRVVGVDVSSRALEIAKKRLRLDRGDERIAGRVTLLHASLMYRDERFHGFDAAAVVEVVEHLDPPRLAAFERVLFECARPRTIVLTTPNREYNVKWESLPAGEFRHDDHRFEWTRDEFAGWANRVAERFGYAVQFESIGPVDEIVGSPTQMATFTLNDSTNALADTAATME